MTVWKEKDRAAWRYKFWYRGVPYSGSTGQLTREDAEEFEALRKRQVRRQVAGLGTLPEHSPRFRDFAAVYRSYLVERGHVRRLDRVDELLRVVLRFWGAKPSGKNPKNPIRAGEPYHDLRMADPIRDPDWIERFEAWIRARGSAPQTRLHYMSVLSRLYRVAMLPRFASKTGIDRNPFLAVERPRPAPRRVTVRPAELRRWLTHAPAHAQLAIAIAALAPKLRLQNILDLRWDEHVDARLQFVTVAEHKTVGQTGLPLVVPISTPLRRLLEAAKRARRASPYVITYRGGRVRSIRHAIHAAATAAGLDYGRDVGGVTFHTIRHTAATLLAEMPNLTEALRASTMGHGDIRTTQGYTHIRPVRERPVLARLAKVLQLEDVFGATGEKTAGTPRTRAPKPQGKRDVSRKTDRRSKRRSAL